LTAALKVYIDENLSPKIAEQLQVRGIDAVTVQMLGKRGEIDENHLALATTLGRVLVTSDSDFIELASSGVEHFGIIFGVQEDHSIGDWVKKLELFCFVYSAEEMINRVEYL
jgi:uncharacterized protein with PIN domain